MSMRYVIRRLDLGWYWIAGAVCTHHVQNARTFEFRTDAELIGSAECPLPLAGWEVVEVRSPPGGR